MDPGLRRDDSLKAPCRLGRCDRQRRLFGGERHAGLPAVQAPDRAGDLEHLAGRT